jgi:hypothetical protein
LDRNLIPADSDVFIRRGLYKLHFEVETGHIAQEVNMVEANNDKDGEVIQIMVWGILRGTMIWRWMLEERRMRQIPTRMAKMEMLHKMASKGCKSSMIKWRELKLGH